MTKPANLTDRELQSLRNEGHDNAADEITRLRAELANARAIDIHSCHDGCTRAGCVAGRLRAEVAGLKLAEEGAKLAFGDVVQQKRDLAKRVIALRENLRQAYDIIAAARKAAP